MTRGTRPVIIALSVRRTVSIFVDS